MRYPRRRFIRSILIAAVLLAAVACAAPAAAPAATHTKGKTIAGRFDVGGHKVAGPIGGKQLVTDLHTLLDRAHVPGPYVLAGHSFGGLYVLTFAAT